VSIDQGGHPSLSPPRGGGASRFCQLPSRGWAWIRWSQTVTRVRPASREVPVSFRGMGMSSSALLASGAPPSPFGTATGYSSAHLLSVLSSGSPLVEFRSSSEFRRLPAARPRSPCTPRERSERSRVRDPPLLGFLLLEHHDLGRPVRRETRLVSVSRGRRGLPHPRRCRPQGWFPLDGSGCFANRSSPVRSPPIFRDAPKLRGPVSCRSRPWSLPSELSPLGEPCPLSRVVASLRVRVRRPPARPGQALHNAFAFAPTLCHGLPRGLTGRPGHDVGFPRC